MNDLILDGLEDVVAFDEAEADSIAVDQQLLIAGEEDVEALAPNEPVQNMSPSDQKAFAEKIIAEVDDHPEGLPQLPLNLAKLDVWAIECCIIPPTAPGESPEPAVIITFASADDPRGTPYILTRDRALKFASQVKKFAQTGPTIEQRAQQAGLAVPPSPGGLIVPGK